MGEQYKLLWLIVVIVAVLIAVVFARECTDDDFASTYSPCDKKTNTRTLIYYKKNDCSGGKDVPVSKETFSCNLTCPNGKFLAPPATTCQNCPKGHFSFSEGEKFDNWTEVVDFKTKCYGDNCKSWRRTPKYMYSGDNKDAHNINSILSYSVDIVRDKGRVEFMYQVDADRLGDGLEFYIDGKEHLFRTSYTQSYVLGNFSLTHGAHLLEWMYKKNGRITKGKDKAMIKWIKIFGSKQFDDSCKKCAPGTYADAEGLHSCLPCPFGTYSDKSGAEKCIPCPEGEYALEGSTKCKPKPQCKESDFTFVYTKCNNGKRSKQWRKISEICEGGYKQPADESVDCAKCPDGLYRDSKTWQCVRCSGNQYYSEQDHSCKLCNSGEAAIKVLKYDKNYFLENAEIPEDWDVDCFDFCADESKAWQIMTDTEKHEGYLATGIGAGAGQTSTLEFTIDLYTTGKVKFEYEIEDKSEDSHSATLEFYISGNMMGDFNANSGDSSNGKGVYESQPLQPGSYKLFFAFERYASYDENARAKIKYIIIEGEKNGAAYECSECPAGFECRAGVDHFTACEPGYSSKLKSEKCEKCPMDTYSDEYGLSECKPCGYGTHSYAGSTQCDTDCVFYVPGAEDIAYNLTDLQKQEDSSLGVIGPFSPDTFNTKVAYYFNICKRFDTKNTKFCHDPLIGYETDVVNPSNDTMYFKGYSCASDTEYTLTQNTGDLLSFKPLSETKRNQGLDIEILSPSICDENNKLLKTTIHLRCDPSEGLGYPALLTQFSSSDEMYSQCLIEYEWKSAVACPACTKHDYEPVMYPCENGKRRKTFVKKKDINCYENGITETSSPPPADEFFSCPICTTADMTTIDTKCINGRYTTTFVWIEPKNCTGGVSLPKPVEKYCEEVELQRNTAVFIVGLAVTAFSALFLGFVWMYRKHAQLYENYTMLSNATGGEPQELGTIDLEDEDEEEEDDGSDAEKV